MTADEWREEILEAAVGEFAARGLRGASVEDITGRVGVSQPYVYRLFGTKKELFLAAAGRVCDRIQEAFRRAAEGDPENALEAMGRSYDLALFGREDILLLLQGFAELWRFVESASRASEREIWDFMATGMLLTIDAAIGLMPRLEKE